MMSYHSKALLIGISVTLVVPMAFAQAENLKANIAGLLMLAVYLSSVTVFAFSLRTRLEKLAFLFVSAVVVAPLHVLVIDYLTTRDYSDWLLTSLLLILGLIVYAIVTVGIATLITRTNPMNLNQSR